MMSGIALNAPPSDDEWNVYNEPEGTQPRVSKRLALLFNEIAEKKIIRLSCKCPRKGAIKDSQPSLPSTHVLAPTIQMSVTDEQIAKEAKQAELNKTFDFDNVEEVEKVCTKRKPATPSSVKRSKPEKITSSMSNVVNDIRRSKLLEERAAAKENKNEILEEKMS